MPTVGETLTLSRSGRTYLVCSTTSCDTVLRSDDGLASTVWTRDLMNAIHDGRVTLHTV